MKLPNGHRAQIGDKLEEYCLNKNHPRGQHKARVFEAALSITLENASILENALREVAATSEEASFIGENKYGKSYVLKFSLRVQDREGAVLSAWIVRNGEDFPRLTKCYML
jgi:hypothetical protein